MSEEKRRIDEKRYAVLSSDSVRSFSEAAGHTDISEDVFPLLGEDAVYRLREVIQNAGLFMRHARRKKLTSDDINKALKNSDTQPVCGYGSLDALPFRQTKEGELYFVDDFDINLSNIACSNHIPHQLGQATAKASWLAVNGTQKGAILAGGVPDNEKANNPVSDVLLEYYDNITKAILGNDSELIKSAFIDLRTNPNIPPLLPYLVNFASNGVKTVNYDISQLTKLLHTIKALVTNPSLHLEPRPFLQLLIEAVMYCVVEPLAASINPQNDHWTLRDYAGRLLAYIALKWDSPLSRLRAQNILALQEVLYDLAKPSCSHYGAIMGLLSFGTQAAEEVLVPHLASFLPHLNSIMEDNSYTNAQAKADAQKVYGAILLSLEYVVRARRKNVMQKLVEKQMLPNSDQQEKLPVLENCDNMPKAEPIEQRMDFKDQKEAADVSLGTDMVKDEPSTSTPVKSGTEFTSISVAEDDIMGPVLSLPELLTTPQHQICNQYAQFYEIFGDSLSAKLPIEVVENFYVSRVSETYISLGEETSKQTGEEMLQQILMAENVMPAPKRLSSGLEADSETRSENNMDFYVDGDEKSSRSERSSRSSRSDRYSEDTSFLGEDADLTVKTVSDTSMGIKLTIGKRLKVKRGTDNAEFNYAGFEFGPTSQDSLLKPSELPPDLLLEPEKDEILPEAAVKPVLVPMKPKVLEMEPMFEKVPYRNQIVTFIFRFLGREQICCTERNRIRSTHSIIYPSIHSLVKSEVNTLRTTLKISGPKRGKMSAKQHKKKRQLLNLYHANLNSFL